MPNSALRAERDHDRNICSAPDCATRSFPGAPWPICPTHLRQVYEFARPIVDLRLQGHLPTPATEPVPVDETGWVYFIQRGDRVKIGWTGWPANRFKQLRPDAVLALVQGSRRDEALAHALFEHLRVDGEWFRVADDLLQFAHDLRTRSMPGHGQPAGCERIGV